jgi:hypothetical protein
MTTPMVASTGCVATAIPCVPFAGFSSPARGFFVGLDVFPDQRLARGCQPLQPTRKAAKSRTTRTLPSEYPAPVPWNETFTFTLQITPSIKIVIAQGDPHSQNLAENRRWRKRPDEARSSVRSARCG